MDTLSDDCLLHILAHVDEGITAFSLGATSHQNRACVRHLWSKGEFQPTIDPNTGDRSEPKRFFRVVRPGDDMQAALDRCPTGAAVLLLPGVYGTGATLTLRTDITVFGRGLATIQVNTSEVEGGPAGPFNMPIIESLAENASLCGISAHVNQVDGGEVEYVPNTMFNLISAKGGALRVQACTFDEDGCGGIYVAGGHTTLVDCKFNVTDSTVRVTKSGRATIKACELTCEPDYENICATGPDSEVECTGSTVFHGAVCVRDHAKATLVGNTISAPLTMMDANFAASIVSNNTMGGHLVLVSNTKKAWPLVRGMATIAFSAGFRIQHNSM